MLPPDTAMPPDLPADFLAGAALFLDFDGCLVDIAPRPDAVVIPPALSQRLAHLHQRLGGAVALVSGRDIADLRHWLPGFPGAMAGSHGAELALDGGPIRQTHDAVIDIAGLHRAAADAVAGAPSVLVERKPHGVALHYRADPAQRGLVESVMQGLAGAYPDLILQPAKMALELRPAGTGKDGAVARLMGQPPFAGRVPVYAGDDLTDEAAMAHVQANGGFGIKIGDGDSIARYRLPDPAALGRWLDRALAGGV